MPKPINHKYHPYWDPTSRWGPQPPPFRAHRPLKPVKGGRWFVRKAPWYARPIVRAGHSARPWKAYTMAAARKHKNRWFETYQEAINYAHKQTIDQLEAWANSPRDSRRKANARVYLVEFRFGITVGHYKAALQHERVRSKKLSHFIHEHGLDSM